jgi:hypothetical protein
MAKKISLIYTNSDPRKKGFKKPGDSDYSDPFVNGTFLDKKWAGQSTDPEEYPGLPAADSIAAKKRNVALNAVKKFKNKLT